MHWIYILQCREGKLYVGETTRLFRRFWEHEDGEGGVNTSRMGVEKVLAIYKVVNVGRFQAYHETVADPECEYDRRVFYSAAKANGAEYDGSEDSYYDAKYLENALAERLMISRGEDWESVRGGEYVRFVIKYAKPESSPLDVLPFCKCGLPCDVKIDTVKGSFFFRCPSKNLYPDVREWFDLQDVEACDFYQVYTADETKRKLWETQQAVRSKERGRQLGDVCRTSPWLANLPTFANKKRCLCCKSATRSMVKYPYVGGLVRALCIECLLTEKDLEVKFSSKKKGGPKSRPRLISQQTSTDSAVAPATPKKDPLLDLLPDPVHEKGDLEDAVKGHPPVVEDLIEDVVKGEDTTKKPASVKKTGPRDPSRPKKTYYKKPYYKK
jgi:hypothetical protein